MKRIEVRNLPDDPLAAAGEFHRLSLPQIEDALRSGEDVMIAMASVDHTHRDWRRAAVAGLARKHTPRRVNAVAGAGSALDPVEEYLASAPGITGQYLET